MKRKHAANFNYLEHYTFYVPGVADMFILLLWLLLGALLGNLVTIGFTAFAGQQAALDYGTLLAYPLMFIPAMMYASAKSRKNSFRTAGVKLDSSHFGAKGGAVCALMVAAATVCAAFCTDLLNSAMPPMPEWLEAALKNMTQGKFWVNFLCVSIFAPVFEEWLCRGMVLRGLLSNRVRPVWAIVVSAAFFALIHLNPWQAIPAFILGCLFGYVYYKTGSLKLTMLMHFTNNTVALICGNVDSLKDMDYWTDVFTKGQYAVLFVAGLVVLGLVVLSFSRIELPRREGAMDTVKSAFDD